MVDGQTGKPGAAVVKRVVVENKHASVLVLILPRVEVVPSVQGIVFSHNLAAQMTVQV